jgi:SAM-dependent methyltransferase
VERLSEHALANWQYWNGMAHDWVEAGERAWQSTEPYWGAWQLPESELSMLPVDMTGLRAIEVGCGTGYVSSWMARRGADVTGVDVSAQQLDTARRLSITHGVPIRFYEASAEAVPEPSASYDFAISEYGASIWCDPYHWLSEAARLLRPGGRLVFLGTHPLLMCCWALDGSKPDAELHRDWFGMHRFDWREVEVDPGGVEWFRLIRDVGFVIDDYLELQAPEGAESRAWLPVEWARRFPGEQVWKVSRTA